MFASITYGQDTISSYFSLKGGVYLKSQQLQLMDTSGIVYYTTDGTEPSSSSKKYSEPILIEKNTVIRATAYANGRKRNIETQSYFIGRKFDMAVVSIVVNPDDFFGYERGIYVKGCCADSVPPYRGANFWKGWERKINIEFYEPDGKLAFNQMAGARIFGGFSKGLPMKSLAIVARKEYGNNRFEHQIFPNKEITKFKSFILRSSGSDFNKAHFRDALLTNLVEPLDIEIQAYRPAVVFINGEYWGIHNVREKINEDYLKRNCGVNPDSVDIMKHRNDLQVGKRTHYQALIKYMEKTDFSDQSEIRQLNTMMDIDNYINYNQTEIYIDNRDAGGNIRYWRPETPGGRWRWILFDTDISFGITDWKAYKTNTLFKMTNKNTEAWPDPAWSTFIIRKLLENDSVKNVYINRFADHLNTVFSEKNVHFKIDSIASLLRSEMPYHVERWRSNTLEKWERNIQVMKDFASERPYYMRRFIMEKFELKDTFNVSIKNPTPNMGYIKLNSINVNNGFTGVYFGGIPIHIVPEANEGYEFVKWEQPIEDWKSLTDNIKISPIFMKSPKSDFVNQVLISEVSIKQDSVTDSDDWIEFYNASKNTIDISNWTFKSKKGKFVFPAGSIIKAGEFIVLCREPVKFSKIFSDVQPLESDSLGFGLSSKKDALFLLDGKNRCVDSLKYNITKDFKELSKKNSRALESNLMSAFEIKNWSIAEMPSPGKINPSYVPQKTPSNEESELDLFLYLGGGLLILGVGFILFFLLRKKQKRNLIP